MLINSINYLKKSNNISNLQVNILSNPQYENKEQSTTILHRAAVQQDTGALLSLISYYPEIVDYQELKTEYSTWLYKKKNIFVQKLQNSMVHLLILVHQNMVLYQIQHLQKGKYIQLWIFQIKVQIKIKQIKREMQLYIIVRHVLIRIYKFINCYQKRCE